MSISISISLTNTFVNLWSGPVGESIEERKREGSRSWRYFGVVVVIIYASRGINNL